MFWLCNSGFCKLQRLLERKAVKKKKVHKHCAARRVAKPHTLTLLINCTVILSNMLCTDANSHSFHFSCVFMHFMFFFFESASNIESQKICLCYCLTISYVSIFFSDWLNILYILNYCPVFIFSRFPWSLVPWSILILSSDTPQAPLPNLSQLFTHNCYRYLREDVSMIRTEGRKPR